MGGVPTSRPMSAQPGQQPEMPRYQSLQNYQGPNYQRPMPMNQPIQQARQRLQNYQPTNMPQNYGQPSFQQIGPTPGSGGKGPRRTDLRVRQGPMGGGGASMPSMGSGGGGMMGAMMGGSQMRR